MRSMGIHQTITSPGGIGYDSGERSCNNTGSTTNLMQCILDIQGGKGRNILVGGTFLYL